MKFDLTRKSITEPRMPNLLIAGALLVGLAPSIVTCLVSGLITGVFALITPIALIPWALIWGTWAASGCSQILMLNDIVAGRPGLSVIRVLGSVLFFGINITAYIYFGGGIGGSSSVLRIWFDLVFIQTAIIMPVLIPLTSFTLKRRSRASVIYFVLVPVLWWWGVYGFQIVLESITHEKAEQVAKETAEVQLVREHNRACVQKMRAIRQLDPVVEAGRVFAEHGAVYMPSSFNYGGIMSFPGLSEKEAGPTVHASRVANAREQRNEIEALPDSLDLPPSVEGWRNTRYTQPFRDRFMDERRAYMAAFNLEMEQLVKQALSMEQNKW